LWVTIMCVLCDHRVWCLYYYCVIMLCHYCVSIVWVVRVIVVWVVCVRIMCEYYVSSVC